MPASGSTACAPSSTVTRRRTTCSSSMTCPMANSACRNTRPSDCWPAISAACIEVERGVILAALDQHERDVQVRLDRADGTAETATFRAVIGCDGAHSAVRRALGIPFEGEAFPMTFMLGDVHIDWDLPRGMALRALRLVENAAPDMFIAIPPRARPLPGIDARTGGARGPRRHRPRHSIRASRPAALSNPVGGQ